MTDVGESQINEMTFLAALVIVFLIYLKNR